MTTTLSKGANTKLVDAAISDGARFQVVVRWSDPGGTADLDVSVLLLGQDGKVRSDEDLVFYNAPSGGEGAVRLLGLGKRTDDDGNGEDRVGLDLECFRGSARRRVSGPASGERPPLRSRR